MPPLPRPGPPQPGLGLMDVASNTGFVCGDCAPLRVTASIVSTAIMGARPAIASDRLPAVRLDTEGRFMILRDSHRLV